MRTLRSGRLLFVLAAALLAAQPRAGHSADGKTPAPACHAQAANAAGSTFEVPLSTTPSATEQLAVAVDGSQTPEQIPDAIAYRLFVSAVSVAGEKASAEDTARRDALLLRVGLSADDQARFVAATRHVKDDIDALEAARRQLEAGLPQSRETLDQRLLAQFDDLRARRKELLNSTVQSTISALTPEGQAQLAKFISEHVKKHIVIYGAPPMNPE